MNQPIGFWVEALIPYVGIGILIYCFQLAIPELIKLFGKSCWFGVAAIALVIGGLLSEANAETVAIWLSIITALSVYFYFTTKRALRPKPSLKALVFMESRQPSEDASRTSAK